MRTLDGGSRAGAPGARLLVGLVLIAFAGLEPAPAAALPRQVIRDFPVSYCPVHSGHSVSSDGLTVVLGSPMRIRDELTFQALGDAMVLTISTCSSNAVLQPAAEIGLDNFAVIKQSAYLAHQVDVRPDPEIPFESDDCYFPSPTPFEKTVGTYYDPTLEAACGPANPDCPLGDDFENPAFTAQHWSFAGGVAVVPADSGHELDFPASSACSSATVTMDHLVSAETYVVDFDWRAQGMDNAIPLVTVDVVAAPSRFFTLPPCRVVDTRNPNGPGGGPALVANGVRDFTLPGNCGVPATARAVAVNLAVTGPTAPGFLTLYPTGFPQPPAATINYGAGQTRGNNAIVPLGAGGAIRAFCFQTSGSTHFILDVTGYFEK
jgi:hypothetical protein